MRRPFWVKGTTPWDTFRINTYSFFSIISDTAMTFLGVLCFLGILYLVFYKIPKTVWAVDMKANAVSAKRKAEQNECFQMEYAGKKFYKFNLEGHEYWYVKEFENNVGFCHSESCPCMTNKVEAVQ